MHAEKVFNALGIKYEHAVLDIMDETVTFFNCSNIPEKLPEYITTY